MNISKKILSLFFIQTLLFMPVFSMDIDTTVDDSIRKNYNIDSGITQIQKSGPKVPVQQTKQAVQKPKQTNMPKLPALPKSTNIQPIKAVQQKTYQTPVYQSPVYKVTSRSTFPIRKGMEFNISNVNNISDGQRTGTNIVFINPKPIKTAYYTIPAGTKFVGRIINSHRPQLTGNGGLICIEITTIILGGSYQPINTRIVKVGNKYVFYENIKGKRSYWKNTVNSGKWGRQTFHKMNNLSASLIKDKTTIILSPFTFLYGTLAGGVSTLTSPVVSIFKKGGRLYIPQGTSFKIKFEEDTKLYY